MVLVEGAKALELAPGTLQGDVLADDIDDVHGIAHLDENVGIGGHSGIIPGDKKCADRRRDFLRRSRMMTPRGPSVQQEES